MLGRERGSFLEAAVQHGWGTHPAFRLPLAQLGGEVVDRIIDRPFRAPPAEALDRRRVGLAAAQLLEALAVGLLVRDVADAGARSHPLDHTLGPPLDRDRGRGADVEYLAQCLLRAGHGEDAVYRVVDVGEAAGLGAV